jgi:hypothetical protein
MSIASVISAAVMSPRFQKPTVKLHFFRLRLQSRTAIRAVSRGDDVTPALVYVRQAMQDAVTTSASRDPFTETDRYRDRSMKPRQSLFVYRRRQ